MRQIICFLLLSISLFSARAQDAAPYDNPEDGFALMRSLAAAGEYDSALVIGYTILEKLPAYHDLSLHIARVYGWKGQFDSAYNVVDRVMAADPMLGEATRVCADLAYWNGDSERLEYCKAAALAADSSLADSFDRYVAAEEEPAKEPITLSAFYSWDYFSTPYVRNWNMLSLGAGIPLNAFKLIPSVNLGYHGGGLDPATDIQLNLDAYWTISKHNYAMLAYGFSPDGQLDYFPGHRLAAEFWQALPLEFTLSAGLRYLLWDEHFPFLTFSLEKYLGPWWLSFRNYLFFKDYGVSGSYYLTARHYFQDLHYVDLTLGYGTAPDEPVFVPSDLDRLNAFSVRLNYARPLSERLRLGAGLGYSREAWDVNAWRNRYELRIGAYYTIGR